MGRYSCSFVLIVYYFISKRQIKIPFHGNSILLTAIFLIIFYTGHLGGNLTHGSTYLLEYAPNPIRQFAGLRNKSIRRKKVTVIDSVDVYLDLISPIINNRCISCHNPEKKKGKLKLMLKWIRLKIKLKLLIKYFYKKRTK